MPAWLGVDLHVFLNDQHTPVFIIAKQVLMCCKEAAWLGAEWPNADTPGGMFMPQLARHDSEAAAGGDGRTSVLRNLSTPRSLLGLLRLDSDVAAASAASSPACGSTPQQLREPRNPVLRLKCMCLRLSSDICPSSPVTLTCPPQPAWMYLARHAAGITAAALGPPPPEDEPDLSDLLWDSNDLLSLSDLLDDEDAAWPAIDGVALFPLDQHEQAQKEEAPSVRCHRPSK